MLSRRRLLALAAALAAPVPVPRAQAQGFAGLGETADGYRVPDPSRALVFPADHGPHAGFRIEWWYVTANLRDAEGARYGVQWTLFRQAIAPPAAEGPDEGWAAKDLWLAHAAATSAGLHLSVEKLARGGVGQAGAEAGPPFAAWIDDWECAGPDLAGRDGPLRLAAAAPGFGYDLALAATGPLALHGEGGFSVKSERGQASRYYSQPWFDAAGALRLGGETREVVGKAWLDREWSSQPLAEDQSGWDWFSLRLPDGACAMLFRLRHADGRHYLAGSFIATTGETRTIPGAAITLTPLAEASVAGRRLPVRWRVRAQGFGIDATLAALNPMAWMDLSTAYWEGPVTGEDGTEGYLEMTGY